MTIVESPDEVIKEYQQMSDLRESEHMPIVDHHADKAPMSWVDAPLYKGLRIVVVQGPTTWNKQTRRDDLVGVHGELVNIIKTGREKQYVFRLHNGESVNGKEIWWKRR